VFGKMVYIWQDFEKGLVKKYRVSKNGINKGKWAKQKNKHLTDEHITKIMDIFDKKEDVEHIAVSIDNTKIAENDYNLSVSSYVVAKDHREKINTAELNKEVSELVEKINTLHVSIGHIIKEIDNG
jgi:type I restriction-modification system DNA methylase subunit